MRVAVASLLNATLVIPQFLYSNVWKDPSQFHDIYQEDTFMNMLKNDINILKELPSNLKSKDLKAIGSLVTDSELSKEAPPEEYIKNILPILIRNQVVHFLGFGNRLGFNSMPSDVQVKKNAIFLLSPYNSYSRQAFWDYQCHGGRVEGSERWTFHFTRSLCIWFDKEFEP